MITPREFAERMCVVYDYFDMCGLPIVEVIENIHSIEHAVSTGDIEQYKEFLELDAEEITADDDEWYHNECVELLEAVDEFKRKGE